MAEEGETRENKPRKVMKGVGVRMRRGSGVGLAETEEGDVDLRALQTVLDGGTADEVAPADLAQLPQVDLHAHPLPAPPRQLPQPAHRGQHLGVLRAVDDHRLAVEQVQPLQLVAPEPPQLPQRPVAQEVPVQVQHLQLRPVPLHEHLGAIVSEVVVREQELLEHWEAHADERSSPAVVDGVAEQPQHLELAPTVALQAHETLAAQTVEAQVQLLQLPPLAPGQLLRARPVHAVIAQVQLPQLLQPSPDQRAQSLVLDVVVAEGEEAEAVPVGLSEFGGLGVADVAEVEVDEFDVVGGGEEAGHLAQGVHVDDVELGVQVVVLVELVDDAVLGLVVRELQTHLPVRLHPPQVLHRLLDRAPH